MADTFSGGAGQDELSGGSGGSMSLLSALAPSVLESAGRWLGMDTTTSGNTQAASNYGAAVQSAVSRVNQGYDDQLAWNEEGSDVLQGLNRDSYLDQSGILYGGVDDYAASMGGLADMYGSAVLPAFDQLTGTVNGLVDEYGNAMLGMEDSVNDILWDGADLFADQLSPYTEEGEKALGYLSQVMGQDPSTMTLSQRRMYDSAKDDMLANLRTSGLRGAGRAGVAAVNEGIADLNAGMYDDNVRRSDAAATTLNNSGYQAAGKVADYYQRATDASANLRTQTGTKIADTGYQAGTDLAAGRMTLADSIGKMKTGNAEKVSNAWLNNSKTASNLAGNYYGNASTTEAGRYQARGDVAMGKALNEASGATSQAGVNLAANTANAKVEGDAYGNIFNSLSKALKDYQKIPGQRTDTSIGA